MYLLPGIHDPIVYVYWLYSRVSLGIGRRLVMPSLHEGITVTRQTG